MSQLIEKGIVSEATRAALITQFAASTLMQLDNANQRQVMSAIVKKGLEGNTIELKSQQSRPPSSEYNLFMDYLSSSIAAASQSSQLQTGQRAKAIENLGYGKMRQGRR